MAQNQNGSGAQSNAQAPPLEAESTGPGEPGDAAGAPGGADPDAAAAEPQASLPDLEDEVNCVVCGVTLDRATEAPQALQQRDLIRDLIAQGLTKDQIKDQLVVEYGPDVLATPATSGFDLLAWLVPAVVVLVALAGILIGLRRWRRAGPGGGGPGADGSGGGDSDGAGAANAIGDADRRRLDRDLERYGY